VKITKIHQKLVPSGLGNHPNRLLTAISYITIHTTGNRNPTATAAAHARLQARGNDGRQASWHYTVDEKEIWQSFKDEQQCWHAGTRAGNETSIGIEICINSQKGFANACEKAAWLTAYLLKKHHLSIENVLQHWDWSGKNCPAELRSGIWGVNWGEFLRMVEFNLGEENSVLTAMRAAGVKFDHRHWRAVFEGTIEPNREWAKILLNRVVENRWEDMDADVIQSALKVLMGKKTL